MLRYCQECNTQFDQTHFNQKYCSIQCRTTFNHNKPATETVICKHCKEPFFVKKYRKNQAIYCSNKCKGLANLKQYQVPRDGICITCGKPFTTKANKNSEVKYCSQKCRKVAYHRKPHPEPLTCLCCGKQYTVFSCQRKRSKFCSLECRLKYQKKYTPPKRKIGVRRSIERAGLISHCEDCGYSEQPKILVVHHLHDRNNHNKENLVVLCPNCHALRHLRNNNH